MNKKNTETLPPSVCGRRKFLRNAGITTAVSYAFPSLLAHGQEPAERVPGKATAISSSAEGSAQLIYFFNDKPISKSQGLERVYGRVEKMGSVLEPAPWDGMMASPFASSIVRLDEGRWRLYYTCRPENTGIAIGVAESEDGLQWTRPSLGQVQLAGENTSLLALEGLQDKGAQSRHGQPQIIRLPDGRWRMYFWAHGANFSYAVAESEDGLRWKIRASDTPVLYHPSRFGPHIFALGMDAEELAGHPPFADLSVEALLELKRLRSNDSAYVYYNRELGIYEAYTVFLMFNPKGGPRYCSYDNAAEALRTVQRRTSEDGLVWSDPQLIITPDAGDPLDLQLYYLSRHQQDGWQIGMLGRYPVMAQTMDIELVFSRDGIVWERPLRKPWFPRGPEDYDRKMILAPRSLMDMGDSWLLLYCASNYLHNQESEASVNPRSVTAAARFPKRRFVGLQAAEHGTLLTRPFIQTQREIFVDAEIEGSLKAELCDPYGNALPGLELSQSVPLIGDAAEHILKWRGTDISRYQYDALSLRLNFDKACLYAIGV